MTTSKVAVIGGGSWGTAIADLLGRNGSSVTLWVREEEVRDSIRDKGENTHFLPGVKLSENISVTSSLKEALEGAQFTVSVVPSQFARGVFKEASAFIEKGVVLLSASKGIEVESGLTVSAILKETLGEGFEGTLAVISGPTFAKEVARGLPAAVTVASDDEVTAAKVQRLFSSAHFRVYTNDDMIGVELGGALKNVIAVASGIGDGLSLGFNARAALITRGLAEMRRLGVKLGAKAETFTGLSGMGDLVLTCTGSLSRNYTVGVELGKGRTIDDITSGMKMVAEGVKTAGAVKKLSDTHGVEMPIATEVYSVLYEGKSARAAVEELMTRRLKDELE